MIQYKYGVFERLGSVQCYGMSVTYFGEPFEGEVLCAIEDHTVSKIYDASELAPYHLEEFSTNGEECSSHFCGITVDLPEGNYLVMVPHCLYMNWVTGLFDPVHVDGAPDYFTGRVSVITMPGVYARYKEPIRDTVAGGVFSCGALNTSWREIKVSSRFDRDLIEYVEKLYAINDWDLAHVIGQWDFSEEMTVKTKLSGVVVVADRLENLQILAPVGAAVKIPKKFADHCERNKGSHYGYVPVKITGEKLYSNRASPTTNNAISEASPIWNKIVADIARLASNPEYRARIITAIIAIYKCLPKSEQDEDDIVLKVLETVRKLI